MDGAQRPAADPLILSPELLDRARRFGFFGLMGLLERVTEGAVRVGGEGPVAGEAIRFRHDPRLIFAAGDVAAVARLRVPGDPADELSAHRDLYEVTTTFLGLFGAASPLPAYIVEEVALEDPDDPKLREFLDLFHHRLISLFYRYASKYDAPREFMSDAADRWSKRTLSIAGLDLYDREYGGKLPVWRLLRLAPLLAPRSRPARSLELALWDVLGESLRDAEIRIQQFVGNWVPLEPEHRMRLGVSNALLGRNAVLGARIFDRGSKFRVTVAGLDFATYRRLLPQGDYFETLCEVVSLFSRDPLDFDLELLVGKGAMPAFKLSTADPAQLGKDTWLGGSGGGESRVVFEVSADGTVGQPSEIAEEETAPPGLAMPRRSRGMLAPAE